MLGNLHRAQKSPWNFFRDLILEKECWYLNVTLKQTNISAHTQNTQVVEYESIITIIIVMVNNVWLTMCGNTHQKHALLPLNNTKTHCVLGLHLEH